MSLLDLLLTFNFRAGNGRQAPETCIIEKELRMRNLTDMYYRILTAPPGYPPDQNFMLVQYRSLEYASNCGGVKNRNGTDFFETIEEARQYLPLTARKLPFEPEHQFLELWEG